MTTVDITFSNTQAKSKDVYIPIMDIMRLHASSFGSIKTIVENMGIELLKELENGRR